MPRIAASILSADFAALGDEVRKVEAAGADWIHLDVMDGHFVPNLTIGPDIVRAVDGITSLTLDTHLMVEDPGKFVEEFARAGSDYISVHAEICGDLPGVIARIRELKAHPAVVINPDTPLSKAEPVLPLVDMLLVMSVHPGFAGQGFIPSSLDKLREARTLRQQRGLSYLIEIDGGVKEENAGEVAAAGADVLVSGSGIFKTTDYAATIRRMRAAANGAA
jgi:ribulose-phosphate 3-epimerase